jgi:hypothetical protein
LNIGRQLAFAAWMGRYIPVRIYFPKISFSLDFATFSLGLLAGD